MRGGISAVVAILLVACSSLTAIQAEGLYAGQRREDLFPNSDVVALVTVEQVSQRLNAADNKPWGDRTVAFHVAAVRSSRVFKGSAPVEITQTGGTVGDFTYNLEHAKYLEAGEQYLVFLDRWSIAEKEGVRDSLGLIGHPDEVLFQEITPGVFENLGGTYQFTVADLEEMGTPHAYP